MAKDSAPIESPDAALAFQDYVGLGPSRSLTMLHEAYLKRAQTASDSGVPTRRIATLKLWSARFNWQERLATAITAQTEDLLAKAAELDAQSYLKTSELIAKRLAWTNEQHIDAVIRMRESVRRPVAKQAVDVSVKHSGHVAHTHKVPDISALTLEEQFALDQMLAKVESGKDAP